MSRRKKIDLSILEAAKEFDAKQFVENVKGEFSSFPDYRYNKKRILYPIWYICLVILCGFFCGCNTVEEIAEYALLQQEWFNELLGQRYKSPSYSTLWWFLVRAEPGALKQYLQKWFVKLPDHLQGQLLALDGKRLRGANFLDEITHVVELFAANDRLVLAVEKVADKKVEKSCLPAILEQVDVKGAIISGDAHFTNPIVAGQIVDADADYLLAVKGNQPNLQAEMENFFSQAHAVNWEGVEHSAHKTIEKDHGRIEIREVRVINDIEWLPQKGAWKKLTSIVEVKAMREHIKSGKSESATRLYICSRQGSALDFSNWVRDHWSIENNCHWQVDVIFEEDKVQMDVGHSAENLGIFRRLAMNMAVIADPERGLASVRRAATFGIGYLKGILGKIFLKKNVKSF
jgi:predicted transposase YbfD/YdcC